MQKTIEFPPKLITEGLFTPKRYKILHGGRGGTKSWGFARALLIKGAGAKMRFLCAREFQNSIADSVHKLLDDQIQELELGDFYEVQQKTIVGRNGTEFAFEGLRHNASKIRSYEGVDIVWVEEAQAVSKASWDTLIPTIRKDGSEIWVSFNPEFEDDETYDRFVLNPPKNSIVIEINWRDNPWFPAVLDEERLEMKERDPDSYDHVWEGKCRRWLEGAIYANELRAAYEAGRITSVPWDKNSAVYTAWDLGRTDDTAIWWYQIVGGEIHIIESYARSGGAPSDFAAQILGRHAKIDIVDGEVRVELGDPIEELKHRTNYEYATHWLPHDAKAKTLAAQGKSVQEQLRAAFGWGKVRITPSLSREDGILAARTTFPRCWFDKDRTADGLKALRRYRREIQRDEISLQATPKHDWASHYADAFRYLSVAWREPFDVQQEPEPERDTWGRPLKTDNWKVA